MNLEINYRVCIEQVTDILNFRFLQFLTMTKFAMVGIFLFIPLTLVMCSTSIKVGHFLGGEVSSRVLASEGTLHTKFPKTKSISSHGKLDKQADQGIQVSCIILYRFLCSLEVLLYSQVLKLGDHRNLRFYNNEEDIIFVPENSLKSIRKKNHRKRYRRKHSNQLYRKFMKKQNYVGALL